MVVFFAPGGKWKPFRWGVVISLCFTVIIWLGSVTGDPLYAWGILSSEDFVRMWFFSFVTITTVLYLATFFRLWLLPPVNGQELERDWWKP